jgi:competence CoiA-like predicted nuclease
VFSNPWYLDQVAQTVVTKTDVVKMQTTTLPKQKVVKRSKTYQKMQICLFILMAQMREKREGT